MYTVKLKQIMEKRTLDRDFWILLADDFFIEHQLCDFCNTGFILA